MHKLNEELLAALVRIDPLNRLRFVEVSMILRGMDTNEAENAWFDWVAPLGLPMEIAGLWAEHSGTPCSDPLKALQKIASRRGAR